MSATADKPAQPRPTRVPSVDEVARETWLGSAPFTNACEQEDRTYAALCDDQDAAARVRCSARLRAQRELAASELHARWLSAAQVAAMLECDREGFWSQLGCEGCGCGDDEHDEACAWSCCSEDLVVHGLALHRRDPTVWVRLRKLGATPALVAEANAILHPRRDRVERAAPDLSRCGARRHTRARRPRERRSAPARRVTSRSAGGGSSGDPESDEPGEARHLASPNGRAAR